MKRYTHVGFIVSLFFATSLLIAAFILLFSYIGCSPKMNGKKLQQVNLPGPANQLFFLTSIKSTKWK